MIEVEEVEAQYEERSGKSALEVVLWPTQKRLGGI